MQSIKWDMIYTTDSMGGPCVRYELTLVDGSQLSAYNDEDGWVIACGSQMCVSEDEEMALRFCRKMIGEHSSKK